ncbi:GMP synthase - Glutamine amidotransferase [Mariprofundus aestuarium]|uniref:GMP synthase-Glutamine amidotransferase n=1 Tax=Mariprofundus aestuarium TaxID=1921086 RepID=A0A2K8KYT4_MARES|nr:type 1 glutamine amidotransferase [Mariprofundus aestuarium]ATX80148.1 GMP synthase - Glutamine amidotransferase [Mariprofundus aestuarium]
MRFLVIQHLDIEPPALIGEVIQSAGHTLITIHLDQGAPLPDSTGFNGIIIMGGPQSANDEIDYILSELAWVRETLDRGLPMLGVCLGAQIMAKASGAEIIASPIRELGWHPVYHTVETGNDPLFKDMVDGLPVFQWHGETFSLTDAMTLLATHFDVPSQAFRLGKAQYGLQFHVEVDESTIRPWIEYGKSERAFLGTEGISLLHRESSLYLGSMQNFCRNMVNNWLKEIAP